MLKSGKWIPNHETRCVFMLGLGFMLVYGAYDAQQSVIEMSLRSVIQHSPLSNISPFDGYYASSVGLFALMLSVAFMPMIVARLGSKLSMATGSLGFTLFFIAFQSFDRNFLFLTSVIQGLGAALLWTGQGAYMKEITSEKRAERNNGIFSATMLVSLLFAGNLLLIGYRHANEASTVSEPSVRLSYMAMCGLSIASNIVFFLMPKATSIDKQKSVTPLQEIASIFQLFRNSAFNMQIIAYVFIGAETAFVLVVFPTCLAFTEKLPFPSKGILLACYAYTNGASQICTGFIIEIISQRSNLWGRATAIVLGIMAQLIAFALIVVVIPTSAIFASTKETSYANPSLCLALTTIFFLAVGDSALKIVKGSILTTAFRPEDTPNAVALGLLIQAISGSIFLFASTRVSLHWHMAAFSGLLLATTASFITVSIHERRRNRIRSIVY